MHIPDGYLSPRTCVAFYAAVIPVWFIASRRVESALKAKELPLLALGASFTFVIMMFNIPVPGGTSTHMVGTTIVAAVIGPWASVVALSMTLALQAFLFGDGGITTLGANCFNMAFLMSFSGYYIRKALSAGSPSGARSFAASALAAYAAVNIAALATALELGVQPLIAHSADGAPLYAPYPMGVALPAMMIPHLVFSGPVEALGTALVLSYVLKTGGTLHEERGGLGHLWVLLAALIAFVPLGLLFSGTPWGEWGRDEISSLIGFVPEGMRSMPEWKGFFPGYSALWAEESGYRAVFYVFSALGASAVIVFLIYLWGKIWHR
jgi:cobalt/nickel transport system permease protein